MEVRLPVMSEAQIWFLVNARNNDLKKYMKLNIVRA